MSLAFYMSFLTYYFTYSFYSEEIVGCFPTITSFDIIMNIARNSSFLGSRLLYNYVRLYNIWCSWFLCNWWFIKLTESKYCFISHETSIFFTRVWAFYTYVYFLNKLWLKRMTNFVILFWEVFFVFRNIPSIW